MISYVLFAVVTSAILALANGASQGTGMCLDSQGNVYSFASFTLSNPDAVTCSGATYCGRPEVRGFVVTAYDCYCLFDSSYTEATIPQDMKTAPGYAYFLDEPGTGPITGVSGTVGNECFTNPLFGSDPSNIVGHGSCLDSQGSMYNMIMLTMSNPDPETCGSATYCGRPEFRGFSINIYECYCIVDASYTEATIPQEFKTYPGYHFYEGSGDGPITSTNNNGFDTCFTNPSEPSNSFGDGACLDSEGNMHKSVAYSMPNADEATCGSATYCGRPEVRGFSTNIYECYCYVDAVYTEATIPQDMKTAPGFGAFYVPDGTVGDGPITSTNNNGFDTCYLNPLYGSVQGDPTIVGLNGQTFKFDGRNGAWYSNLKSDTLTWNMQFQEFETCPEEEKMFVSALSFALKDSNSRILIRSTEEVNPDCYDPNKTCLGGGKLQISFDGGDTFTNEAGDYHFSPGSRLIAHNAYGSCSWKWYDFSVSSIKNDTEKVRGGGRRVQEKSPIEYVGSNRGSTLDPSKCDEWVRNRVDFNDLFKQNGFWSTIHIVTPLISFHIEFRQQNPEKVDSRSCLFRSLDTWMTAVSPALARESWQGILGETRLAKYDARAQKEATDRFKILAGQKDSDYEVDGPFGTNFAANKSGGSAVAGVSAEMSANVVKSS